MNLFIDYNNLIKRTSVKGVEAINIAENICNNDYYISTQFKSTIVNNINELWTYNHEAGSTFKSYLYGLQPISYLCNGYEEKPKDKYLYKAKDILMNYLEFLEYTDDPIAKKEFVVSSSSICIIYLLILQKDRDIFEINELEKIEKFLIKNSLFLSNPINYLYSNHGLWQDIALLTICLVEINGINTEKLINIALERIGEQINYNFTEEYINIENSFFYHKYNLDLINKIYKFIKLNFQLNESQKNRFSKLEELIINGNEVFNQFIRQDKTLPLIGDTEVISYDKYDYIPKNKIYKKSGIALLKDDNYHITIKSGVQGRGHKHYDDLSFCQYYKGIDTFIDSGKYNYEKFNKLTNVIKSVFGHNTIIVNDKDYTIKNKSIYLSEENLLKSGIYKVIEHELFDYINLYNNFYKEANLSREYILIKPNIIIIIDYVENKKKNKIGQNFVINEKFKLTQLNENYITLIDDNDSCKINIKQLKLNDYTVKYNNKNKSNNKGFSSKSFNVLEGSNNIIYETVSNRKGIEFITSILIDTKDDNECRLDNILYNDDEIQIFYSKDNVSYKLNLNTTTKELINKKEKIFIDSKYINNTLEVNVHNYEGKVACYITVDGKKKEKIMYQDSGRFIFNDIIGCTVEIKVFERLNDITNTKSIILNLEDNLWR